MPGRVSSPRFVGRRDELDALASALQTAKQGAGSVTLIAGEAGIGKSRLIAELAGMARADELTVVVGECLALGDGELPYAPVIGALRSLLRARTPDARDPGLEELSALLAELTGLAGSSAATHSRDGGQSRLFERLLTVLTSSARERPLVVVVEDLQWADRSTVELLGFLARAARHEPIALVISYRSDELDRHHPLHPVVVELERAGRGTRLELRAFDRSELSEQVGAIRGADPDPELVGRLLARSEGNPFFTEELLASAELPGSDLSQSLSDTLLARVDRHPDEVRAVLRITAAVGRTADHDLLAAVAVMPEPALTAALRAAVDDHLLTCESSSGGYAFRHALLREAIYADLLPGERRALHLSIAQALADDPGLGEVGAAASAELAHHWYAAGELPTALAASLTAGRAAEEIHASSEAWRHYARALEIWDRVLPVERELPWLHLDVRRHAAEAAHWSGDNDRALALGREVIAQLEGSGVPVEEALAHERLGRYLWAGGRAEDALLHYRRAAELMPAQPASRERALVLAGEAQALMLCELHADSSVSCEHALAIAEEVGAEDVQAQVLNTMCPNLSSIGEFDRAIAVGMRALEIARRLKLGVEMGRGYVNTSNALDEAGRVQESIALAQQGIDVLPRYGAELIGDFLRAEVADRLLRSSRWTEAEALLEEVSDRSPTGVNAGAVYGVLGELLAERGRFDAARRALDRAQGQIVGAGGSAWLGPHAAARASLEIWAGRPQVAASIVSDSFARIGDGERVFFTSRLYEVGLRACAELAALAPADERTRGHQLAAGRQLLARLDRMIARTGDAQPVVAVSRAMCAAELSRIGEPGDPAPWADAGRQAAAVGDRYRAAYAGWREAEALLVAGGDRSAVQALLRDAYAVAVELGAEPLREQLESLGRRARIVLSDDLADAPAADQALAELELTPREVEVLALVGDGLTNREIAAQLFISDKTASVHVSRILAKLSVPNRAAAAATAQRLGLAGTRAPAAGAR